MDYKLREELENVLNEMEPLSFGLAYASGIGVTALMAWAHKKYMDVYGKANQACASLKGKEGRMCRKNYTIEATKAEVQALKYARSKCAKTKDFKSCVQAINEKIKKLEGSRPEVQYKVKA
jgi:hypothetical protein